MRFYSALLTAALVVSDGDACAASPAITFELVDAEPVTIRVAVFKIVIPTPKGTAKSCAFATPIFEGRLEKGKPLVFASDEYVFCVSQTRAPFLSADFGPPILVTHNANDAPLRMLVRSRAGPDGVAPTPKLWMAPVIVSVYGADAIGVRVAAGNTVPCHSSSNTLLFDGVVKPGAPRAIETDAPCVCVTQTYAPFVAAGWTEGAIRCRPLKCVGKYCAMEVTTPFAIALASKAP